MSLKTSRRELPATRGCILVHRVDVLNVDGSSKPVFFLFLCCLTSPTTDERHLSQVTNLIRLRPGIASLFPENRQMKAFELTRLSRRCPVSWLRFSSFPARRSRYPSHLSLVSPCRAKPASSRSLNDGVTGRRPTLRPRRHPLLRRRRQRRWNASRQRCKSSSLEPGD